jgi:uncharacterized protein (TIGR03437 family)
VDGLTTLGFGSGDVTVRRLWVLPGANQAIANVTVSPTALQRETVASVISGFQVYSQPLGFQVVPADPSAPLISLPVQNADSQQNSLYPGTTAIVYGRNLQAAAKTPAVTVANTSAQVLYSSPTQIYVVIPAGAPTGPVVMTLQGALPIVLQIDAPPPSILGATSVTGTALGASQAAAPGDSVTLAVSGMPQAAVLSPSRVGVAEGGVSIPVFTIQPAQDGSGDLLIQFALAASVTGQEVPVTVSLDGDLSMPSYLTVMAP